MGYDPRRFCSPPGDFWRCPLCKRVLQEPIQICYQYHSVCSGCVAALDEWCPVPGCDYSLLEASKRTQDSTTSRFIASLRVGCANATTPGSREIFCSWIGPLADESLHSAVCHFSPACPHNGCSFRGDAKSLRLHLQQCSFDVVECPNSTDGHCSFKGPLNLMSEHLVECEKQKCPQARYGCQFRGTQAQIDYHAQDCLELLIAELLERRRQLSLQNSALLTPPISQIQSKDSVVGNHQASDAGSLVSISNVEPTMALDPLDNVSNSTPWPSMGVAKGTQSVYHRCNLDRSPPTARSYAEMENPSRFEDDSDGGSMDQVQESDMDEPMWDQCDNKKEILNNLDPLEHATINAKQEAEEIDLNQVQREPNSLSSIANRQATITLNDTSLSNGPSGAFLTVPSQPALVQEYPLRQVTAQRPPCDRSLDDDPAANGCSHPLCEIPVNSLSLRAPKIKINQVLAPAKGDILFQASTSTKAESRRDRNPIRSYRSMDTLNLNSSPLSRYSRGPGPIRNVGHHR
ncbi:E3 ubiquitin-protein ligase traf7, partial [Serendipita sp. 400]